MRVNREKTDFGTKQRKSQKMLLQQNRVKCDRTPKLHTVQRIYCVYGITHMTDVENFQISPHVSCKRI